ncbi:MAG: hypothetical protein HY720_21765 [Planctomycetes bacterium]|nr:hypothetical protein [Planctomycetota bacterium]
MRPAGMSAPRYLAALILALAASAGPSPADAPALLSRGEWKVEVHPGGGLGRVLRDPDFATETARWTEIADRYGGPVREWPTRFFVFRTTDADWVASDGTARHVRVSMSQAEVDQMLATVEGFREAVRIYSGGRMKIVGDARVIEEPLARLSGTKGEHLAWADATEEHIGRFSPEGEVASVLVFWKAGDVELGKYWGGSSGGAWRGAGYTSIAVLSWPVETRGYVEVAIHEWLHQIEWAREVRMGYSGLPYLHDAEEMGYFPDRPHPGWMNWLRDFLTVYITPAIWDRMEMLRDARPGRPSFEGGHVQEWLVLGPFDNADDRALETFPGDVGRLLPRAGRLWRGKEWRLAASNAGALDFNPLFEPSDGVAALAHAYARSDRRRRARLWLGSDDGVRVWANGREVFAKHAHRGHFFDADSVDVDLEPGWNRFLFLVEETVGGWGLSARLATPEGGPIEGLEWRAEPPAGGLVAGSGRAPTREAGARELPFLRWKDVEDDPWRALPILGEKELRAAVGDPELSLVAGDAEVLVVPGKKGRVLSAVRTKPDPTHSGLDNGMNLRTESLARLAYRKDGGAVELLLVRPDLACFYAENARPAILDRLIGRLIFENRPLLVALAELPRDERGADLVTREIDLFPRSERGLAVSPYFPGEPRLADGVARRIRVALANDIDSPCRIEGVDFALAGGSADASPVDGTRFPLDLAPGESVLLAFEISPRGPAGPGSFVTTVRAARGEEGFTVEVARPVEVVQALGLSVLGADGRPFSRAASGNPNPLVLVLSNRVLAPVEVELDWALPEGWDFSVSPPRRISLAAGERREVKVALGIPAARAGTKNAVRLSARTELEGGRVEAEFSRTFHASPWWFLGPFDHRERQGLDRPFSAEKGFSPKEVHETLAGEARWFDLAADAGEPALEYVDLAPLFVPCENVCAYATLDVHTEKSRDVVLSMGSDDCLMVWVNGKPVHRVEVYRPAAPDQERIPVRLEAGRNRILVKVCQGGGAWGFYFRVLDPEGKPAEGLRYLAPRPE